MPRYHFNIHDGVGTLDPIGSQLAGPDEARRQALRLASDLLQGEAVKAHLGEEWRVEVTDGRGMILFRIDILIMESAALG